MERGEERHDEQQQIAQPLAACSRMQQLARSQILEEHRTQVRGQIVDEETVHSLILERGCFLQQVLQAGHRAVVVLLTGDGAVAVG